MISVKKSYKSITKKRKIYLKKLEKLKERKAEIEKQKLIQEDENSAPLEIKLVSAKQIEIDENRKILEF